MQERSCLNCVMREGLKFNLQVVGSGVVQAEVNMHCIYTYRRHAEQVASDTEA